VTRLTGAPVTVAWGVRFHRVRTVSTALITPPTVPDVTNFAATVDLSGSGSLALAPVTPGAVGTVTFAGTGTLTTSAAVGFPGGVTLSGSGGLNVATIPSFPAAVPLSGTGQLGVTGQTTQGGSGAVTLTGTGSLTTGAGGTSLRGVNSSGGEFGSAPGVYDTDYHYDSPASLAFLATRGHRLVRLPFLWERVQRTLSGALDAGEMGRIDGFVSAAAAAGLGVMLDCHNYGGYNGVKIGAAGGPTSADLADLWARLSTRYAGNGGVLGYSLMNEPNGLGVALTGNLINVTYSTWTPDDSGCTVTGTTFGADNVLKMTRNNANSFLNANAPLFNVTVGTTYTLSADFYPASRAGRIRMRIEWQTSGGSPISTQFSTQPTGAVTTWTNLSFTATAPATAAKAKLTVYVDDTTTIGDFAYVRNVYAGIPVPVWHTASQAALTSIRGNGDGKLVTVCGDNWSGVADWQAANGTAGWITDSASNYMYEGHHYWDADHSGTYSASYSVEDSTAVANGYASLRDRVLSELRTWLAWLSSNSARGFVGEMGWPRNGGAHTGDYAQWSTLGDAWYSAADAANLGVAYWSTSEWWGTYPLSLYDTSGGALATPNSQAATVEAHQGVLTLRGTDTMSGSGTLTIPTRAPAVTGTSTLSGAGSIVVVSGVVTTAGTATFTGSGSLGVSGAANTGATGTVTLAGSGALAKAATVAVSGTTALSGIGSLGVAQTVATAGTVGLAGTGSLGAAPQITTTGTATLTGAGTLNVPTRIPAIPGTVTLAGSGTLNAAPVISTAGTVVFTGTGSLAVIGAGGAGAVTLSGTGSLSVAVPNLAVAGTVTLSGAGALTRTALVGTSGTANLAGAGALGVVSAPAPAVGVPLSGTGSLSTVSTAGASGTAAMSGIGQLAVIRAVPISLTGTGSLAVSVVPQIMGTGAFGGTGVLVITFVPRPTGAAGFGGTGVLVVALGAMTAGGAVTLTGAGVLGAVVGFVTLRGAAALGGAGLLEVVGVALGAIVHRPNTGTTARAASGRTIRPNTGTTGHT
jgi:hypothetical protein